MPGGVVVFLVVFEILEPYRIPLPTANYFLSSVKRDLPIAGVDLYL